MPLGRKSRSFSSPVELTLKVVAAWTGLVVVAACKPINKSVNVIARRPKARAFLVLRVVRFVSKKLVLNFSVLFLS